MESDLCEFVPNGPQKGRECVMPSDEDVRYHRLKWKSGAIQAGDDLLRRNEVRTVIAVIEDEDEKGAFAHVHFGDGKPFSLRAGDEYRIPNDEEQEVEDDEAEER